MVKSSLLIKQYKKLNIPIISAKISTNKNNKKIIKPVISFKDINNYNDNYIKENYNGYLMKMGIKLECDNYLVVLVPYLIIYQLYTQENINMC